MKTLTAAVLAALCLSASSAVAANYDVDFKLTTTLSYDSLQLLIDYSATPGNISGGGTSASCTSTLNAVPAFNNCDTASYAGCASTAKKLKSAQMDTAGIAGPVVLFTCRWVGTSAPVASQFVISVADWSASHTTAPSISASRIQLVP